MSRYASPETLPDYLNDELERSVFTHTMTSSSMAGILGGILSGPEDPLLQVESESPPPNDRHLRAFRRLYVEAEGLALRVRHDLDHPVPRAAQVTPIGNSLRELEAMIRQVWWDTACFVDPSAAELRSDAKKQNPDARDASSNKQIDYLAERCHFSPDLTAVWKKAELHSRTHRKNAWTVRELDTDTREHFETILAALGHATLQCEAMYSAALVRIVGLLEEGPSKDAEDVLRRSFPAHTGLRAWLFAQIDDPAWLRILGKAEMLGEDLETIRDDQMLRAPESATARLLVRLMEGPGLGDFDFAPLLGEWVSIDNPRLHTDCARVLTLMPQAERLDPEPLLSWLERDYLHSQTTRLIGDQGCLRFPSACLDLARVLLNEGQRSSAAAVARRVRRAVANTSGEDHTEEQLWMALRGAPGLQPELARALLGSTTLEGR